MPSNATSPDPLSKSNAAVESPPHQAEAPIAELLLRPGYGILLLVATCLFVFAFNLGDYFLWEPDEGRNAEIARQMMTSGNWLIPALDSSFHDKPALFFWLLIVAAKIFGMTEWALRLPSAVAACLGVIATALWGARYVDRLSGLLGAFLLATVGGYIAFGRVVMIDATFAWWLTAAFLYGSAWILDGRERGWPAWPFYVLLSFATLTKGPVALVLAALTFPLLVWRAGVPLSQLRLKMGLSLTLLIAGGWYLAASFAAPDYVWDFVWVQNWQRFAGGRGGHQLNKFAFFYILPAVLLPWSLYVPAAVVRYRENGRLGRSLPLQFCGLWFVVIFGFFSFSDAKIVTYLLPAFPPVALLLGDALADAVRRQRLASGEETCHGVAFIVVAAFWAIATPGSFIFLRVFAPEHSASAAVFVLGAPLVFMGWRWLRQRRFDLLLATVWAMMLFISTVFYGIGVRALDSIYSLGGAADVLRRAQPQPRVFAYAAKVYSLEFYTDGRVTPLEHLDEAVTRLASGEPTVLLTKEDRLDDLNDRLRDDAYVWWRGQRTKVLVGNRPPPG